MRDAEKIAAVEALLFLYGEALSSEKIASLLKISPSEVRDACHALAAQLADEQRGLQLMERGDAYQLATKPVYEAYLEAFVKEGLKEDLTPAALETLSLIAYFGPVTRAHIDFVRGVNSSFTLRNLLMRGLIARTFAKGNMYSYEVTFDFLKQLGVGSVEDLPKFSEYQELKDQILSAQDMMPGDAPAQGSDAANVRL